MPVVGVNLPQLHLLPELKTDYRSRPKRTTLSETEQYRAACWRWQSPRPDKHAYQRKIVERFGAQQEPQFVTPPRPPGRQRMRPPTGGLQNPGFVELPPASGDS